MLTVGRWYPWTSIRKHLDPASQAPQPSHGDLLNQGATATHFWRSQGLALKHLGGFWAQISKLKLYANCQVWKISLNSEALKKVSERLGQWHGGLKFKGPRQLLSLTFYSYSCHSPEQNWKGAIHTGKKSGFAPASQINRPLGTKQNRAFAKLLDWSTSFPTCGNGT